MTATHSLARWIPLLAVALGAAPIAHADARHDAITPLYGFDDRVDKATKRGVYTYVADDVAACRKAVADGTAAGWKPSDEVELGSRTILWKRAGEICDAYAKLLPIKRLQDAVGRLVVNGVMILPHADDPSQGTALRVWGKEAPACIAAIDAAIAGGVAADFKVLPQDNYDTMMSLGEMRAICVQLRDRGGASEDDRVATEQAAAKALRDKWAKLGAKGARLTYLIDIDDNIVLGKNCRELTPKQRVKSPVFYQVNEDDSRWFVWKTTFPGGKQRNDVREYRKADQRWRCW